MPETPATGYTPFYGALDDVDQCDHSDGEYILVLIRENSPAEHGWHWMSVWNPRSLQPARTGYEFGYEPCACEAGLRIAI